MTELEKTIKEIALHKIAGDVLSALPTEQLTALVADALTDKLGTYAFEYGIKKKLEDLTVAKAVELLATPEYQKKIENRARNTLEELLPVFSMAVAKSFLDNFGNRDKYSNSAFCQKFEKEIALHFGEKGEPL